MKFPLVFIIFSAIISCSVLSPSSDNISKVLIDKGYRITHEEENGSVSVSLYGTKTQKGDLSLLCEWKSVESINFQNVTFAPGFFSDAAGCGELKQISIINSTHADVEHFQLIPSLYLVAIGSVTYTDVDIQSLSKIDNLKWLMFGDNHSNPITSHGVKYLAENAKKIEQLKLEDTKVDDTVFQYLLEMPKLREVSLRRTKVTDDAADRFVEEYRRRYNREVIVYT